MKKKNPNEPPSLLTLVKSLDFIQKLIFLDTEMMSTINIIDVTIDRKRPIDADQSNDSVLVF